VPRSFWNPHSPDTLGVEFAGVGVTNNVLASNTDMYALRFKAQHTGFVDQVSIYSGALTNNPLITAIAGGYVGQRRPWIVELIPVSGFDPGEIQFAFFTMNITSSSDVIDETFGAVTGDELDLPNDGKFLYQSGPNPAVVTVEASDASTFPLTAHVLALGVDVNVYSQVSVERVDQNGISYWFRYFGSGFSTQHIAEAYQDSGSIGTWRLWTPSEVRQFDAGVGNRRLRFRAVSSQPNIFDYLNIHVDYINERRAGVGLVIPTAAYQWVTASFHQPNVTTAVPVTAGVEYIVVVRPPCTQNDYKALGSRLDYRTLNDVKQNGITPVHYTFLDWDAYTLINGFNSQNYAIPNALDAQLPGIPAIRIFSAGSEIVDTVPYSQNYSGAQPVKIANTADRVRHSLAIAPVGTTKYRYLRTNISMVQHPGVQPDFKGGVDVSIRTAAEALVAGPIRIDETTWRASEIVGNDIWGDEYRSMLLDFGTSFDLVDGATTHIDYILTEDTPIVGTGQGVDNPWRVGTLISEIIGVTGADQTAPSFASAAGISYPYPSGTRVNINTLPSRRADLQVMLISDVPAITGTAITVQSLPVSGGACDGCSTTVTSQVSVVGTGTSVASANSDVTVTLIPPLPVVDIHVNDVLLCLASVRNLSTGTVNTPIGWTQLGTNPQGNLKLFAKNAIGGGFDMPPQVTFAAGAVNATALAQCTVVRGTRTNLATLVTNSSSFSFITAQHIDWSPLVTQPTDLGIRMGWKQDFWTSVDQSPGFTRIDAISSQLGSDSAMIWDYERGTTGWSAGQWIVTGGSGGVVSFSALSVALAAADEVVDSVASNCFVRGITYNHVCWTPTTLTRENFVNYEVQRLEPTVTDPAWMTVAIISPTGTAVTGVVDAPTCFDDYSMVYDTSVCYRVRQKRVDGGLSEFIDVVCGTTPAPTGSDLIITTPGDPTLSVAFAEAHTSLPIEHEWELLDAEQQTLRTVYGRDKHFSFRPLEKLGLRFRRRLTISALCTPVKPCLQVADGIRQVVQSPTGLVVRDTCGNRWYAAVAVPTLTQLHDPDLGDIWFANIEVTELSTPVLTEATAGEVFP